jgi:four helix bundle protein
VALTRFTEIRAWQAARELAKAVYSLTDEPVMAKDFALRDQLRRAAISSMSNIAEGFSRNSHQDFARFLDFARGSVSEVQSLLFICLDIQRIDQVRFDALFAQADKTIALIAAFQDHLRPSRLKEDGTSGYVS